jgi:hemolysin III
LLRKLKEPFCGISHLFGAALSVAALIILMIAADGRILHIVGFAIYGASLIMLYTASGLAHSLKCTPAGSARWERIDYAAIFLLIAGTYTPICLVSLGGPWGWGILIAEWTLAAAGIYIVLSNRGNARHLRTLAYLAMGWLVLIAVPVVVRTLAPAGVAWLLAGGIVYSVGAMFYLSKRPNLFPGKFESHELWHCMVLLGSACHFIVMIAYVA